MNSVRTGTDTAIDVAVIGGGIAGASCAYHLACQGLETVLLEKESDLGTHSTGRSAASLVPGYGGEINDELTTASRAFFDSGADGFANQPLLTKRPLLWIYPTDASTNSRDISNAGTSSRDISNAGISSTGANNASTPNSAIADSGSSSFPGSSGFTGGVHDLVGTSDITIEEALAICPYLRPDAIERAAVQYDCHDIDVEELLQAFIRGARKHGAVISRHTEALSLERKSDHWLVHPSGAERGLDAVQGPGSVQGPGVGQGHSGRSVSASNTSSADVAGEETADLAATTQRASNQRASALRARVVVNAAGAWADALAVRAGLAPAGLQPLKRTAFIAPVKVDTHKMPLVFSADSTFYFKPDVPGVLLCSRADETPVSEIEEPQAEELDVAYTIERINTLTTLNLRSVLRTWTGLRVFNQDRNPIIRAHHDDETFIWCAGLGGTGIQTSPATGALVAELVLKAQP